MINQILSPAIILTLTANAIYSIFWSWSLKIAIHQITESFKEVCFQEEIKGPNRTHGEEPGSDFRFPYPIDVQLTYYRSGKDLFFLGELTGTVEGQCSRCLKSYQFPIEKKFDFVLTPEPLAAKSRELSRDELGLSFYSTDEIDLSPFIGEQAILTLPTRPLCDDQCCGLCSGCGMNLNSESCQCPSQPGDTREGLFRNLRLDR